MQLPDIQIIDRDINKEVFNGIKSLGVTSFKANLIASRFSNKDLAIKSLDPSLKNLSSPMLLKDISKATRRLIKAITDGEVIGLETDHDCDGQTSHAILHEALNKIFGHPLDKIRSYIGHRMQEGYGLSDALVDRILSDRIKPSLIITADNGSTDEPRIKRLKDAGIDTIVTDHHAIPVEGVPVSAIAVLNPTQKNCNFGDPCIAGCMVSWLFMAATRNEMISNNIEFNPKIQLVDLLDFVAIGTIADCVSMSRSLNNRIVAHYGMQLLSKRKRLCWQILFEECEIDSSFIGFKIGPLLNADGRLSDALGSVDLLLCNSYDEASRLILSLSEQNENRKKIQKNITKSAILHAATDYQNNKKSICVYLEDGHAGVHGISASKVKDSFGMPTIIFSPKQNENNIITGSARSIDNLDIKKILDDINNKNPDILLKYGGHHGAAGMSIQKNDFNEFKNLFELYTAKELEASNAVFGPVIYCDQNLDGCDISTENYIAQQELEPFGRECENPIFRSKAKVVSVKFIGKDNLHIQLHVSIDDKKFKCIWFFGAESIQSNDLDIGQNIQICYQIKVETFRQKSNMNLHIKHLYKI